MSRRSRKMAPLSKISEIKLPVLKTDNYAEWKIKITSLLKSKELYAICSDKPTSDQLDAEDYDVANEHAKTIIYTSLDGKTTQSAGICEHAYQLWQKVTNYYEGSKEDLTGLALSKFMEMKKEGNEKVGDFLGRYEIALNNLKSTEFVVDLTLMIYVLCKSMPSNIKEGIKVWRTIHKDGEIDTLLSYIRANYREDDTTHQANNTAFLTYTRNKSSWKNKYKNSYTSNKGNTYGGTNYKKGVNSNVNCTFCKKQGHSWQNCYKLKNKNEEKNREKPKEQAHMALERSYQTYQQYIPDMYQHEWIIDSGATSHMTHDKTLLLNYSNYDEPTEILVGDGEHIEAHGKGWLFIHGKKEPKVIKDVLYVPKMAANLFSVKAGVKDGFEIKFDKTGTTVIHEGEKFLTHYDGCLFTIDLRILNLPKKASQKAFAVYDADSWHRRFGHCGKNVITNLAKFKMVDGMQFGNPEPQCEDCMLGKSCRKPHPSRNKIRATDKQAIVHFDTVDMTIESLGGRRYFVLGTEEYSGYKLIEFVTKKSEITDCVKLIINSVILNSKRPVACIYTDNGTEFVNTNLSEWLRNRGIIQELSSPYNAQQNGRAEASNKTVISGARVSLISSGLPKTLWAEACSASTYVLNRLPSTDKPTKTRYELYYGKKPNVGNLHEFGELAIRLIPKEFRDGKLNPVAKKLRFVGYTSRFNTFRLYDEEKERIIIDCNVRFTNRIPKAEEPIEDEYATIGWENYNSQSKSNSNCSETDDRRYDDTVEYWSPDTPGTIERQQYSTSRIPISAHRNSINDSIHAEIRSRHSQQNTPTEERPVTRSMTNSLCPIYDPMSLIPTSNTRPRRDRRDIALFSLHDEPQTVKEAKEGKHWKQWQKAMQEEIQALEENNTWTIVDKPPNIKPIKAKWIFKLKLNTDGSIERYKARLVAKGYSQIPNIDYKETFAPVASMTTVRMMLAAAAQNDYDIIQFDIKTAFLYGDLDEEIYMECPEYYDSPKGKVCKLVKSLYGLKQAPRQWHKKFDSFLKKFDLMQSNYDRCLYYSTDKNVLLTIYVDDGLIVTKDHSRAMNLIDYLKEYLIVKTMDCKSYLGLEIIRDKKDKSIFITQRQYVKKTLERFGMDNCKPSSTPEEVGQLDFANSPKLDDNFPFKELVGCLLYMVTCTRPDIAHAVSIASRTSEPTELHWNLLKRIMRYLSGTKELGIEFRWEQNPELVGYSDADYANDKETRRSTSGFVIMWGNSPITWKCQRQSLVTLSTTEAEYISGTEMVKKIIPLKSMMTELGLIEDKPVKVFIDNKSTVNIVNNEQGQERTKHIDVREKWLNEHHDAGNICVEHVSGEEQRADILTKPLHKSKFAHNRGWLMKNIGLIMAIILISMDNFTNSVKFTRTKPVYYRASDVLYTKQLQRYHMKVVIMDPCETYFTNITDKAEINKKLITDCQSTFSKIARLDHCSSKRAKRNVLPTGNLEPSENFFGKIFESFGITPNNSVNTGNNTQIALKREERIAPLIGGFALIVMAGLQLYTLYKTEVNVANIKTLAEAGNEERKFLQAGYGVFKELRNTIHEFDGRLTHLEQRVDGIDRTLEQFPKIIALVNHYDNLFRDIGEILADIDNAALYKRVSMSIFKLAREIEPQLATSEQAILELCEEEVVTNSRNLVFHYRILIPIIEPKIKIMKTEAFRFWNYTTPGKVCWMKYGGPRYIMVNTTNSCYQDVQEYWINDKTISAHPCLKENRQLDPIERSYHSDICRNKIVHSPNDIQKKQYNGFYKIYCYGNNITIHNKENSCPDFVFELPVSDTIKLNGEIYDVGDVSTITINAVEQHVNNEISEQLRIDKIKIYGSNLTNLETQFARLSRLTNSIMKNITIIESPIAGWLSSPFKAITEAIGNFLSTFGTVMSVILAILAFIILFPVLEIGLVLVTIGYRSFSTIASPLQRFSTRMRSMKIRRAGANRIRRYLIE